MKTSEPVIITRHQASAAITQKGIDAVRRCRDFIRIISAAHMAAGGSDRLADLHRWASDRCAALIDVVPSSVRPGGSGSQWAAWDEWDAWVMARDTCAAIDDYIRHIPEHGETVDDLLAWVDQAIEDLELKMSPAIKRAVLAYPHHSEIKGGEND